MDEINIERELEDIVEEEEKRCILSIILFFKFVWNCRKIFQCINCKHES
jgi:hypothetical protein